MSVAVQPPAGVSCAAGGNECRLFGFCRMLRRRQMPRNLPTVRYLPADPIVWVPSIPVGPTSIQCEGGKDGQKAQGSLVRESMAMFAAGTVASGESSRLQ